MSARVLTTSERPLWTPDHPASLADFTYIAGEAVNPKVVVEDPNLTLYCLDDEGKRAIFA